MNGGGKKNHFVDKGSKFKRPELITKLQGRRKMLEKRSGLCSVGCLGTINKENSNTCTRRSANANWGELSMGGGKEELAIYGAPFLGLQQRMNHGSTKVNKA